MKGNNKRTMAAPPEVLSDRALRAQFMHKHGRIPVPPNHWSLAEGASDLPSLEPQRAANSSRRTALHVQTVLASFRTSPVECTGARIADFRFERRSENVYILAARWPVWAG